MNRNDILRKAAEAGFLVIYDIDDRPVELTSQVLRYDKLYKFANLVAANDTALFQQLLAMCSKDGGWTLEEAANTICEIENILLARLEGNEEA